MPQDADVLPNQLEPDVPDEAWQFLEPTACVCAPSAALYLRPVGGETWNERPVYLRILFPAASA